MRERVGQPGSSDAAAEASGENEDQTRQKQAAIEGRYADRSAALQATAELARWQER